MDLAKLEYLLMVEKTGSISKAAELLYMSQPSLSKSVASVEKAIGCKIFQRTPSGLKPTPEGARYLLYAHQVVNLHEEMLADLRLRREQALPRKRFVMGLTPMRSTATLSKTLWNFANAGIPIEIHSVIAQDAELPGKLLAGEVDIAVAAILPETRVDPALVQHHLCSERMLLAVSARNPVLQRARAALKDDFPYLSPGDLRDQHFILGNPGTVLHEMASRFFQAEGLRPKPTLIYEDNIDIARALVARGFGICLVNERLAKADPREDTCYCRTAGTLPIRNVYALWRKSDAQEPDMAILFRHFCEEWLEVRWTVDEGTLPVPDPL